MTDWPGRWWDFKITAFYAHDVERPHVPHGFAIETVHRGESSRDMEIEVFRQRMKPGVEKRIGMLIVSTLAQSGGRKKIYSDDEERISWEGEER